MPSPLISIQVPKFPTPSSEAEAGPNALADAIAKAVRDTDLAQKSLTLQLNLPSRMAAEHGKPSAKAAAMDPVVPACVAALGTRLMKLKRHLADVAYAGAHAAHQTLTIRLSIAPGGPGESPLPMTRARILADMSQCSQRIAGEIIRRLDLALRCGPDRRAEALSVRQAPVRIATNDLFKDKGELENTVFTLALRAFLDLVAPTSALALNVRLDRWGVPLSVDVPSRGGNWTSDPELVPSLAVLVPEQISVFRIERDAPEAPGHGLLIRHLGVEAPPTRDAFQK